MEDEQREELAETVAGWSLGELREEMRELGTNPAHPLFHCREAALRFLENICQAKGSLEVSREDAAYERLQLTLGW